jgi:hypothetical protein
VTVVWALESLPRRIGALSSTGDEASSLEEMCCKRVDIRVGWMCEERQAVDAAAGRQSSSFARLRPRLEQACASSAPDFFDYRELGEEVLLEMSTCLRAGRCWVICSSHWMYIGCSRISETARTPAQPAIGPKQQLTGNTTVTSSSPCTTIAR